MPEIVRNCPLCRGENHKQFAKTDFRGYLVINQRCRSCGFVFQSPRMTPAELDEFYTRLYRKMYQGNEDPTQKELIIQHKRALGLLEFVRNTIPMVNRHLDIGCSTGSLLKTFQEYYGSQIFGVEPGESYRKYTSALEIPVVAELADLKLNGSTRFNLISMAHVLEHLPDPVYYLTELRMSYLTETGWLLLEVPNLFCHDSFEVAHLSNFSFHTLCQTVNKAGFETLTVKKHGHPRSERLPLYISLLARVRSDQLIQREIKQEANVVMKRRLGMFRRRIYQKLFPGSSWISISEEENIQ